MRATRRNLLTASAGLVVARAHPAAAAHRSLTFAAYGGLFQELFEPDVVEPFTRANRDVDVLYYAVPSSAQALAALRQQRGRPEIDVVLLGYAAARTATDEGLLETISPGSLPILAELTPSATLPGVAGRAVFTEPLVLLFDAAHVPAPPSWKSLWSGLDERTIAVPAPPDPLGIAFTVLAGRLFGGGNEERSAANGIAAIADLANSVMSWDPRPDVYHCVGDGIAKFGVGWNMPSQVLSTRLGGRLGVAFPAEGTVSRVTTANIVKGSRQPDAARQFIAYLLGREAQKAMVEQMSLGPVNTRAHYPEDALQRTASTPARVARSMPVDWPAVNAIREDIIRRWHDVIPGSG